MDPLTGGIMAGAGLIGNIFGGIMGSNNAAAANAQSQANMRQQYEWQKEFAQNGIRWKVSDAQAAGIHPLFALGGSTASYSPSAIQTQVDPSGDYLSRAGQDVSRAIASTQTAPERKLSDFEKLRQAQELERGGLQNDALRLQIQSQSARLSPGQIGPSLPTSVSPAAIAPAATVGNFEAKPPEVLNPQPSNSGAQAGPSQPSVRWERNPDGSVYAMPTGNMDDFSSPGYTNFQYQNRILPFFSNNQSLRPPNHMLPADATGWRFAFPGRWVPHYPSGPSYGEGVHYAPRRARALPRVILNP